MGRRGGKRGGFNSRGGPKRDRDNGDDWSKHKPFTAGEMSNANFEEYYKEQGIVSEEEWPAFMQSLKEELPTTFRVTGSRAHAMTISDIIHDTYVPTMQAVEHEGVTYGPPEQLSWYPESLAWQLSAPRRIVRKSEPFKVFQRFLVGETEVGNLSRQEAVSMIPPLLLDVEPHHICLDMCAAPGSKTAQILEALNPHHTSSSGLLIANDSDYKRTHMLVHQTGRMPSKALMVTNCDASMFPNISLGDKEELRFDRILADVPCSGDGTLRKNMEIWRKWGPADGNGLHTLQLRILKRAMDMLKPGGRLVYSTCSFNPVENEAVIAAALQSLRDFSIVDASSYLPKLKRRPGLTNWKVAFNVAVDGEQKVKWYDSYNAYLADPLPERSASKDPWKAVNQTLWPSEGLEALGLEKTMRLLPHDQNTGGFFVCVLEKAAQSTSHKRALSPVSAEADTGREVKKEKVDSGAVAEADAPGQTEDVKPDADADAIAESSAAATPVPTAAAAPAGVSKPDRRRRNDSSYREDPFTFADPANSEVQTIVDFFRLKDSFPRDTVMVRNEAGDVVRVVYLTNSLVKQIIQNNDASKMRLVFAGVKGFVRQDSQNRVDIPCKWRVPSEGLPEVLPHVGEGFVKDMSEFEGAMDVLRVMVEFPYPSFDQFPKAFAEWVSTTTMGNVIARFPKGTGAGGSLAMDLVLPLWRARGSLSLLIDKREKSMLSLRTFGEDICRQMPKKGQPGGEGGDAAGEEKGMEGEGDEEEMEGQGQQGLQDEDLIAEEEEAAAAVAAAPGVGLAEEAGVEMA